jgi:formamidopyrimidine-DNA glycosylase
MPELPEVFTITRNLKEILPGSTLINTEILEVYRSIPTTQEFELLKNEKVKDVDRISKYILIHFENLTLQIHLGMTGRIRFSKEKEVFGWDKVRLEFINSHNEKLISLINKLKTEKDALKVKIPNIEAEFNNKLKEKSGLVKTQHKNEKLSLKEGMNINLTDANLFYENIIENADKFGIEIRENTSQSYNAKASASTETESITNQSDSNDLSDKENISIDTNNKSKITGKTEISSQTWSKVNASSPRKSEKFLTSKQITANSSNVKTITEANIQRQIIASSDESSNSESSSFSEDESKENITNQAQSNTISTRSARDVGKDLLINPNNLKKPNN